MTAEKKKKMIVAAAADFVEMDLNIFHRHLLPKNDSYSYYLHYPIYEDGEQALRQNHPHPPP